MLQICARCGLRPGLIDCARPFGCRYCLLEESAPVRWAHVNGNQLTYTKLTLYVDKPWYPDEPLCEFA